MNPEKKSSIWKNGLATMPALGAALLPRVT